MMFWLAIIGFILLILLGLSLPLLTWKNQHQRRQALNIQLYQQQMQFKPEPELAAELSQRLLSDSQRLEQQAHFQASIRPKSAGLFSKVFVLALIITALPLAYYFSLPRYQNVQTGSQQAQIADAKRQQQNAVQKNDDYIIGIQNKLRANPNNGEAWFHLGQAYMLNNEFENALESYARASYVLGEKPYILGAVATVLYYQAGQKLSPKAQELLQQTLQQDPQETASLSLLASDAFLQADYAQALKLWQQILDSGKSDIDRRSIIQSMQMAEMLQQGK